MQSGWGLGKIRGNKRIERFFKLPPKSQYVFLMSTVGKIFTEAGNGSKLRKSGRGGEHAQTKNGTGDPVERPKKNHGRKIGVTPSSSVDVLRTKISKESGEDTTQCQRGGMGEVSSWEENLPTGKNGIMWKEG